MKSRTDNPHYHNDPNCNLMTDSQEKAEDCRIESRAIDFFGQFDDKLEAIVKERIKSDSLINNKTAVVADLIIRAFKRECK